MILRKQMCQYVMNWNELHFPLKRKTPPYNLGFLDRKCFHSAGDNILFFVNQSSYINQGIEVLQVSEFPHPVGESPVLKKKRISSPSCLSFYNTTNLFRHIQPHDHALQHSQRPLWWPKQLCLLPGRLTCWNLHSGSKLLTPRIDEIMSSQLDRDSFLQWP
jgi:hypothetical protein